MARPFKKKIIVVEETSVIVTVMKRGKTEWYVIRAGQNIKDRRPGTIIEFRRKMTVGDQRLVERRAKDIAERNSAIKKGLFSDIENTFNVKIKKTDVKRNVIIVDGTEERKYRYGSVGGRFKVFVEGPDGRERDIDVEAYSKTIDIPIAKLRHEEVEMLVEEARRAAAAQVMQSEGLMSEQIFSVVEIEAPLFRYIIGKKSGRARMGDHPRETITGFRGDQREEFGRRQERLEFLQGRGVDG